MAIEVKSLITLIKKTEKTAYRLLGYKNRQCDLVYINQWNCYLEACYFMNTYALTARNFVKKSQQGKLQ